jgi:hypothetical protein
MEAGFMALVLHKPGAKKRGLPDARAVTVSISRGCTSANEITSADAGGACCLHLLLCGPPPLSSDVGRHIAPLKEPEYKKHEDYMRTTPLLTLLLAASTTLRAGEIEILSLTANGRLTFTNSFTNGLFTVQWAPAIPTTNWNDNWDSLRSFIPTGSVTTVSVPMFYRVTCLTNQFFPIPVGLQSIYNVTNSLGTTGTLQVTSVGSLKLTSGKEYSILELLDSRDCALRLLRGRSTENEFYTIPFDISQTEGLESRNGPPGTTWTNQWCDGSSDQITIAANEIVTVPGGTFGCVKTEMREINNQLRFRFVQWIKPGFGMVKQVDYGDGTRPPDVYELSSWAYRPPH